MVSTPDFLSGNIGSTPICFTMNLMQKAIIDLINKGYSYNSDGNILNPKGIIRKLNISKKYYQFTCRFNGNCVRINVHKFIAFKKFGNIVFNDKIQVRHLDGNSLNNIPDNIDFGTRSQNMMDVPSNIRIKNAKIASSFIKKYNHDEIKKFHNGSYKKTMQKFNISSKSTLNYILNN